MKVYIAGPMRGYPNFNFAAFDAAQDFLEDCGWEVFNPADKDRKTYGEDFASQFPTGDQEAAEAKGFCLRTALAMDLSWICKEAEAIYMLEGWEMSRGAMAEHATAVALGLEILYE